MVWACVLSPSNPGCAGGFIGEKRLIEKALFIMISMYALSFSLLVGQYIWADPYGVTMTSFSGTPIQTPLLDLIKIGTVNTISNDVLTANSTTNSTITGIERAFTVGYKVGWDIVTMLTGTYIFNLLLLFDIPPIFIAPIVVLYAFLMFRAITSYIRNG